MLFRSTGLSLPDVFYFGSLPGDADGNLRVNALDLAAVKQALNTASTITGRVDFNRDGRVNALDVAIVKQNLNRALSPITAAIAGSTSIAAAKGFSLVPLEREKHGLLAMLPAE